MSDKFEKAPQSMIDLAYELIQDHHYGLKEARIGFMFRTEPLISKGKKTYGKAIKVSDQNQVFMELDFIIWIDQDAWLGFKIDQRRALLDHELYHCEFDPIDLKASIRHHDVEEFAAVAYLYGAWNTDLLNFQQKLEKGDLARLDRGGDAVARQLTFASRGRVVSVDPDSLAGESVS